MTSGNQDLKGLRDSLRAFAAARDWEQFHTPKNLAMALAAEAGELLEIFQWLTPEESQAVIESRRDDVEAEMADILIYLVRLSDVLGVDLLDAAAKKVELNASRYPAHKAAGSAAKYTELDDA